MHLIDVVLFLHIATAIAAFSLSGVMHASEYLARTATTVEQLRHAARPQRLGPLFGVLVILLFGLGSWLVGLNDQGFSFGDAWVWTAMVALVVLGVDGPLVLGRHASALDKALAEAGDGPLTPELRELVQHPVPWAFSWMNTFLALGVVLNMVTKPGVAGAALVLVAAAVLGAVLGLRLRGAGAPVAAAAVA